MSEINPAIRVAALTKRFGPTRGVEDLDLQGVGAATSVSSARMPVISPPEPRRAMPETGVQPPYQVHRARCRPR